ncbi:MAG: response regulator [Anaerolineae bacterium]
MNTDNQSTILIVDDNIANLKFLIISFQRKGFEVLTVDSGEGALAMVEQQPPDIILLDILMPGIDGFETCRRLKAGDATKDIPVIFMTALAESVDKVKGLEIGAADYVTKPFDVTEVVARINTHLTIHRLQQNLLAQNRQLQQENEKRRRVQEALRESRGRYRLLAENSTDLISRQTLDGRLLYVSPACLPLLGYRIEEMIGQTIFEYIYPEDLAAVQRALTPGDDCPSTSAVTCRVCRKDGEVIWLEIISRTVCDADLGEPYEMVSVSRNVTEQVNLTAQLKDKNAELDAFAHTVAHDLKNPLGTIVSTIDLLLMAWDRLTHEQILNFLHSIKDTGYKGIEIINALLLLSSIRKEDVSTEPLNMADIVGQVMSRLTELRETSHAEVTVPSRWPMVVGYAPWVEEVWMNYLSNAMKYGGDSPRVTLGYDDLHNGTARFWVTDYGPGIDPQQQGRLFNEFVRLGDTNQDGHGLGLSIVRRIVDRLGGEVGLESRVGDGSTFYFTLPLADDIEPL